MDFNVARAAILSIGLILPAVAGTVAMAGDAGKGCEQLASRSANTSSEHAMLATYFRQRAAELRRQAERRSAGSILLDTKSSTAAASRLQLEKASRREQMIAEEYERMAVEHDRQVTAGS